MQGTFLVTFHSELLSDVSQQQGDKSKKTVEGAVSFHNIYKK